MKRNNKNKNKREYSRFVNLEPDSSGSEEYESNVYSEEMNGPQIEESETEVRKTFMDSYRERLEKQGGVIEESSSVSTDTESASVDEVDYSKVAEAPPQSALCPTNESPLLFLIKCKIGREKAICHRVTNNIKVKGLDSITSVIFKQGLKGYIYIESYKKTQAEEALHNLKNVFKSRIHIVPMREMVDVVSYKKDYSIGEYARIRIGKYKADLVQILEEYVDCCLIKAIPRLENNIKRKFDPDEYRNSCIKKDEGYYYNRDLYKDGYLHKIVFKKNLDFHVEPTFTELEELSRAVKVAIDDKVIVTGGDYKNVKGRIVSINDGVVAMINEASGRMIEIDEHGLEKLYEAGDEASYKGINGTVLHVENGKVILGIKDLTEEVEVFVNDLNHPVSEKKPEIPKPKIIRHRRNPLLGKKVKIKTGNRKGLGAVIREVVGNKCRVQVLGNLEFLFMDMRDLNMEVDIKYGNNIRRDEVLLNSELQNKNRNMTGESSYDYARGYNTPSASATSTPALKTPNSKTPAYFTPGAVTPSGKVGNRLADEDFGIAKKEESPFLKAIVEYEGVTYSVTDITGESVYTKDGKTLDLNLVIPVVPGSFDPAVVFRGEHKGTVGNFLKSKVDNNRELGQIKTTEGSTFWTDINEITKVQIN